MKTIVSTLACFLVASVPTAGQQKTLVDLAAEQQEDFGVTSCANSPRVTLEDLLQQTAVILRGVVGPRVSALTADLRWIETTFEIDNPLITETSQQQPAQSPSPTSFRFMQDGGTVQIGGISVTAEDCDSPGLAAGEQIIALLQLDAGIFRPTARYTILAVRNGRIESLVNSQSLMEFVGRGADEVIGELLARRNQGGPR